MPTVIGQGDGYHIVQLDDGTTQNVADTPGTASLLASLAPPASATDPAQAPQTPVAPTPNPTSLDRAGYVMGTALPQSLKDFGHDMTSPMGDAPAFQTASDFWAKPTPPAEKPAPLRNSPNKLSPDKFQGAAAGTPATPLGALQQAATGATSVSMKVPSSFQPMGGNRQSPEAIRYQRAADSEVAATQAMAKVQMERAKSEADLRSQQMDQEAQLQAKQEQMQGDYQRARQAQTDKYQKLADDFANTNTTIDPHRLYGQMSTGQKVLAAFGTFLGGLSGGPNQAMGILQKAMDDDIDAQKTQLQANLTKKGQALSMQQNLLGMMRSNFSDDFEAQKATEAAMWKRFGAQLDTLAAKYQSPQLQAQAQQLAAQIQQKAATTEGDLNQKFNENAARWAAIGVQQQELGLKMREAMQKGGGNPENFVPGLGFALDKESAKHLRERKTATEDLGGALDSLIAFRKKNGSNWTPGMKNQAASLADELMLKYQKNEGLSRLSDADINVMKAIQGGDPSGIVDPLPTLERIRTKLTHDLHREASNYLVPGQLAPENQTFNKD